MSEISWSKDRLSRASLGAMLQYGALDVLNLAAKLGPQEAWRAVRAGEIGGQAMLDWASQINPEGLKKATIEAGMRFVVPGDGEWPACLDQLLHCQLGNMGGRPVGLWVAGRGNLATWTDRAVAMVGSRASTQYGNLIAKTWAFELASRTSGNSWTVVSGGAFGIDTASHEGALMADGRTVGIFANGLDMTYPPGNERLVKEVLTRGLAVSEMPPGSHPTRHGFLARNRLIAALSLGTLVVEAGARSGARNTVSWAGALGRVVMAVPGSVKSAMSVGPHRLIRDGEATLVSDTDDVRALLAPFGESPELPLGGPPNLIDELTGDLFVVREALPGRGGASINQVALAAGLPVPRCVKALHELAERGFATADDMGRWRACRNPRDF